MIKFNNGNTCVLCDCCRKIIDYLHTQGDLDIYVNDQSQHICIKCKDQALEDDMSTGMLSRSNN